MPARGEARQYRASERQQSSPGSLAYLVLVTEAQPEVLSQSVVGAASSNIRAGKQYARFEA